MDTNFTKVKSKNMLLSVSLENGTNQVFEKYVLAMLEYNCM